jgi:CrcB protein
VRARTRLLLVSLGGAIGSGARYLTALAAASLRGVGYPWGTLLVNVGGSLLIGIAMELIPSSETRLFIVTGVMGGFTTYSTFNQETLQMLRAGAWPAAMLNLFGTVIGCLLAGVAGFAIARLIRG